jgi:hypothetical protein
LQPVPFTPRPEEGVAKALCAIKYCSERNARN